MKEILQIEINIIDMRATFVILIDIHNLVLMFSVYHV